MGYADCCDDPRKRFHLDPEEIPWPDEVMKTLASKKADLRPQSELIELL